MYPAAAAFPSCRTSGAARYSGRMTIGKTRSALTVILMLLFAAVGQGDDVVAKNGMQGDLEEAKEDVRSRLADFVEADATAELRGASGFSVAPAQSTYGSSGMRIELFGRVGLPLLNVSAEDSIQLMGVPPPGAEGGGDSISASRLTSEFGWGAGARLMSGNWGIEASYNVFESRDLTPSWLVADSLELPEEKAAQFGQPLVASEARLILGQAIRVFQLGGGAELSLGLGAGWIRATDSGTDRLLSSGPSEFSSEDLPILPAFVSEVDFTADRTSVVYVGSLGVAFRFGRIMLRPRVDVVVSRELTTDLTIGIEDLGELGAEELGEVGLHFGTSVRPTIFLFSVDVGLGN